MYTKFGLTLLLGLLPLCALYAQNPRAATPDEIVRQLTHSDYRIVFDGVSSYMGFSPDQRTSAMKAALVQALKNQNERIRQIELRRAETGSTIYLYEDHGSAEMALHLVEEVSELKDPRTIPLLLRWSGMDDEIIDFGRQAFEPVLKFVETPEPGIGRSALRRRIYTLRMMVDYWGLSTFSASELERMKQVATKYIFSYDPNSEKNFSFLMDSSIRLAASLREGALLQMAHALVNDDAEMAKRGYTTPEWVRETAAKALAGTLEERQYVRYEERKRH
ncbi:MAG: hypothetical protein OXD43_04770 [Bacteroidetes bacterium]|nr:hypothetical protein [Bacteroidota bacterium]